jgi:formiminoglutamase
MSDLGKVKEVVATYEDLVRITSHFTQNRKALERMIPFERDALYFFSLDSDAIDAGVMEGVSAVNHKGLPLQFVDELLTYCLDVLKTKHFGIYEYNPVFDNLSQKGARALSSLIYKILDR